MRTFSTLAAFMVIGLSFALIPFPKVVAAPTVRTLAITTASAGPKVAFAAFDGNPVKVFDINGDGTLEIIAQNDNQWVYIFDSKNGTLLAELTTVFPAGWTARSFNGPEVSILNQDGNVRLVVANSAATITVYRFDPVASTTVHLAFVKEWERRLSDCFSNPGMDSKPVLADLDLDGRFEILAQTEELGVYALGDDGRLFWKACIGGGNGEPTTGDLDRDGFPDVVFSSDAGIVTALAGRTGGAMWTFNIPAKFNIGSGSIPVGAAVGQLDGKLGPDVVVGARDSHDPDNWSNDHAVLVALDSAGKLLWGRQDPQGNPLTYTHPIITDADADGKPEVYWADWNTNGHNPPTDPAKAWKPTGPANFYRYDAMGNLTWRQSLGTWWSNKDIPLADVDGDGVQEMLVNGPNGGHDGIWYLDTRTGAKEEFVDAWPWKVQRSPVVADLWNSTTMQWVLPAAPLDATAGGHAILVYDTRAPYNSAWPHLPYPTLGPPPPPPSGTFNATFTIKSPNEWWQEVSVKPDTPRSLSKVQVRVNGGSWLPMTLRSWGAWTSSYNSRAGTTVEFLATDAASSVSQSAPFKWLDGTLTKGSVAPGDPPPPTTFTATFEPTPNVNEWWVEVKVGTSEPLSKVDARVNGGGWVPLSATGWGTWAKSFFVEQGSTVQFQATNNLGATATSANFTWLSPPGNVTTTFDPRSVGNDWWVEVKVTSGNPITKAEARVNNGSWIPLNKTNWGTWAKSFFVADGSTVQFQATDSSNNTYLSGSYVWV